MRKTSWEKKLNNATTLFAYDTYTKKIGNIWPSQQKKGSAQLVFLSGQSNSTLQIVTVEVQWKKCILNKRTDLWMQL